MQESGLYSKKGENRVKRALFCDNRVPIRLKCDVPREVVISRKYRISVIIISAVVTVVALAVAVALGLHYSFLGSATAISVIVASSLLGVTSASVLSCFITDECRSRRLEDNIRAFNEAIKHGSTEIIMSVDPAFTPRITTSFKGVTKEEKLRYKASELLVKSARDSLKSSKSGASISKKGRVIHDPFLNRNIIVRPGGDVSDLEISSIRLRSVSDEKRCSRDKREEGKVSFSLPVLNKGLVFISDRKQYDCSAADIHPRCIVNLESRDGLWSVITGSFDNSWGVSDSRRLVRSYVLYQVTRLLSYTKRVSENEADDELIRGIIETGSAADLIMYGDSIERALEDPYPSVRIGACSDHVKKQRAAIKSIMKIEDIPDHRKNGISLKALRLLCVLSHTHDNLLRELTFENQVEIITAFLTSPYFSAFAVRRIIEGILVIDENGKWQTTPSYDNVPRFLMCIPGLCDTLRVFAERMVHKPRSFVNEDFIEGVYGARSHISAFSDVEEYEDAEEKLQSCDHATKSKHSLTKAMFLCAVSVAEGIPFRDIETRQEYEKYRETSKSYEGRYKLLKGTVSKLVEEMHKKDSEKGHEAMSRLVTFATALRIWCMFKGDNVEYVLFSVAREDSAESLSQVLYEALNSYGMEDIYSRFAELLASTVEVPALLPSHSVDFSELLPDVSERNPCATSPSSKIKGSRTTEQQANRGIGTV